MEEVVAHLSVAELEARFRAASDARSTRHLQAIWLLAKGHRTAEVAATTAFGVRWVEKLRARYNAVYGRSPLCKSFLGEAWHARCELLTCIRPSVGQTAAGLDG
jgi:hypothetical protein